MTDIEWVLNPPGNPAPRGITWNPFTGCLQGCEYCYARRLANGRLKKRYLANGNIIPPWDGAVAPVDPYNDPFYPTFWPLRLAAIDRLRRPTGVFVCDMSDLVAPWWPMVWRQEVFSQIRLHPQHWYYLLTKQYQELDQWNPYPDGCRVGATVPTTDKWESALHYLDLVDAPVRFLSVEPFLSKPPPMFSFDEAPVEWLIIGALTGTKKYIAGCREKFPDLNPVPYGKKWSLQPPADWVRELVTAASAANIPVWIKNNILDASPGEYRLLEMRQEGPRW